MKRLGLLMLATSLLAAAVAVPVPAVNGQSDAGFVQLFNGKDLTGWKTLPEDKSKWEVKDGAIVGTGGVGHIYSERGDYENFIYRAEININEGGNSGQYIRARMRAGFPPGYEVQINATHRDPVKTGSLYNMVRVLEQLHKPGEWFTQEVTADGNKIQIKVNGKQTVDHVDAKNTHTKGHFAFQQHHQGSEVRIRKVEVKELPPTKK